MSTKKQVSLSTAQTKQIASKLAKDILKQLPAKQAQIFALQGDLGSGKTTFTQGLAKGLGIKEKITSPTFIVMRKYAIKHKHFKNFYHFDCYRLEKPEEILELGFEEIINNPQNIVAIEWPKKIKSHLPENIIMVKFKVGHNNKREICSL